MRKLFYLTVACGLSFASIAQQFELQTFDIASQKVVTKEDKLAQERGYTINDYFKPFILLDNKVNNAYVTLTDEDKVAQLIMPAMGRLGLTEPAIMQLVESKKIGGILLLNGTKEQFKSWVTTINAKNESIGALPFLFSADAEPSLVNRKITGSTPVKKANELLAEEDVRNVAQVISKELKEIGINYNFAPVSDMSSNSTVGYRGFGKDPKNIVPFSWTFVEESTNNNIISTIKHFPGHGLVSGDTHSSIQSINGELKELKNFKELIAKNVPSVMIGHLAVTNNEKYNTKGLPATASPVIVNELLRKELGYTGLVVTDAMNMGGITQVQNANVAVVDAGCDIVLMPLNAEKAHAEILKKYQSDEVFKAKVDAAVKRIIRMKICLGLIK